LPPSSSLLLFACSLLSHLLAAPYLTQHLKIFLLQCHNLRNS
jgi:hypothetical protein